MHTSPIIAAAGHGTEKADTCVIKVCFWTTSFQADVLSLARHMCKDPRFEPVVVLEGRDSFLQEPIQQLFPVECPLLAKDSRDTLAILADFNPDLTIVDNHFPPRKLSKYLLVLWHGFGWKGPNDVKEFATVHKNIKKVTGYSAMKPNRFFRWHCFGPTDMNHRHHVSGFAQENLISLGSPFFDDLMATTISRAEALTYYPKLSGCKNIVLLAMTWHYGRVFSHWGDDIYLFNALFDDLAAKECAIILRMHDRNRYDSDYLAALEALVTKRDGVVMKYKDNDRDNLLDMLVSNVIISNFSSILNYFYVTEKPSLHVYPVKSSDESFLWRTWRRGKVRSKRVANANYVWKLPPEENGGLLVTSYQELLEALELALADPECCSDMSRSFITRHMLAADGKAGARICDYLSRFCSATDAEIQ